MKPKKRNLKMLVPTLIMANLAIVLLVIGYTKGAQQHVIGMKLGLKMTGEILPLLLFAFIVAGMVQVLLPSELISKWVGTESGFKGIMIGTLTGAIAPGGPYVSLPLAAALLKSGAGIGTMVAFLTGWSLWAVSRLPMEIGILGWKITLIRLASTFIFPPIAGLIAQLLFSTK
jgi:uncharacterized membrane protein YraQ (UPF0718 family)